MLRRAIVYCNNLCYHRDMDKKGSSQSLLPLFFKTLLWSYDFPALDPDTHRKAIIVYTLNYGDLPHWRWITRYYGKQTIRDLLETIPAIELRPRVRRLASIIFSPTYLHD